MSSVSSELTLQYTRVHRDRHDTHTQHSPQILFDFVRLLKSFPLHHYHELTTTLYGSSVPKRIMREKKSEEEESDKVFCVSVCEKYGMNGASEIIPKGK